MPQSRTRLMHTSPSERPFYCITGDLSGEGLLLVIDESTHELVVQEGAESGTVSVIVTPKGARAQGVSPRPGTRMLEITPPSSDPMRQAGEAVEELKRRREDEELAESARRGVELARQGRRRHVQGGAIGSPHPSPSQVLSEGED